MLDKRQKQTNKTKINQNTGTKLCAFLLGLRMSFGFSLSLEEVLSGWFEDQLWCRYISGFAVGQTLPEPHQKYADQGRAIEQTINSIKP